MRIYSFPQAHNVYFVRLLAQLGTADMQLLGALNAGQHTRFWHLSHMRKTYTYISLASFFVGHGKQCRLY